VSADLGTSQEDDLVDKYDEAIYARRKAAEAMASLTTEDFFRDVNALAKHYIDQFFLDKMFYCGGPIPKRFLHDAKWITMVIDFDISKGVEMAYKALENTITIDEVEEARKRGDSTSDVKLVNETLKLLARSPYTNA
jgi:5-methylthioribose kinase